MPACESVAIAFQPSVVRDARPIEVITLRQLRHCQTTTMRVSTICDARRSPASDASLERLDDLCNSAPKIVTA
jgi:hypothetical protein